jgi:hypothetical protein
MYRKELFYRGLSQIPVYIEDTLTNSPYYFNIVEIPKVFGPGKNSIRFNLNENNLDIYNDVSIEIIDSYGNTVYYETPQYFQSDEKDIRVLTVYLYDNISNGPLTITFVGYAKTGLSGEPIPAEYKNKYNVRYTTVVDFNRFQKNTSRLLFSETPAISISEARKAYVSRSFAPTTIATVSGSGIYRFQQTYPLFELPQGQSFTNDMLNGTLTLTGSTFLPDFSGYVTSSYTTFSAKIINILSSQAAILNFPWTASIFGIGTNSNYGLLNTVNVNSYTLTYNPTPTYTTTNNFNSYINLNISNLDPTSGYLKYVKLYGKSQGDLAQYELIGESLTNNIELLTNSASYIQYDRSNVGYFLDSSSFQNFWNYNPTYLSATFNTSSLFNSLYLNPLVDTTTNDVLFTSNVDINFQKGSAYRLYFNYVRNTDFVLEIYMSGPAFVNKTGIGQRVFYLDSQTFGSAYINLPIDFLAPQTGTGKLQFKILSGNFYISDISLKSGIDQGFNPSNFNSYFPINVKNRDDVYDFKVELIDDNNQINSYEFDNSGSVNIQITGSNQYIGGNDNLLPGRLNLGDSPSGGVSLDGTTNTVSTYGYTGGEGWIMWSGSRNISGSNQPGSGFYFETGAPNYQYFKAVVGGKIESNAFPTSSTPPDLQDYVKKTEFHPFTESIYTFTQSYYTDSASFNNRINNISFDTGSFVKTGSFNTFTSSIHNFTQSINTFTSSVYNFTQSINTFTSSYYTDSSSFNSRITDIVNKTGSFVTTSSFNTFTSSIHNFTQSYYNDSSSFNSRITDIVNKTGSFVTTSSFNNFTQSIHNFTQSYYNDSGSFNSRITDIVNKTGSFVTTSSFNLFTSSIHNFTQSINTFTQSYYNDSGSFNSRITDIVNKTGSFVLTSSFNTYTASAEIRFAKLVGGNTFNGDQTVRDGYVQVESGSKIIKLNNGNIVTTNGIIQLDSGSNQIKLSNNIIRLTGGGSDYTQVGINDIQLFDNATSTITQLSSSIKIEIPGNSRTTINSNNITTTGTVVSPLYLGASSRTECPTGADTVILTYTSGSYSSFILDGYAISQEHPEKYGLQSVYIIQDPITANVFNITSTWPVLSTSASAVYDSRGDIIQQEFFNTGSFQIIADDTGGIVSIIVTNSTGDRINYKTVVKAFTV